MARAGFGAEWTCLFANDFDPKKSRSYEKNWGTGLLKTADVNTLVPGDIPGCADLAWASFPCQDLSLAGIGAGLKGARSGAFWPFWNLMRGLRAEGRAPNIVALENVCGALTSHDGRDFAAIATAFQQAGYRFGAMTIDAALFLPHSRPRLFMIGVKANIIVPPALVDTAPSLPWHSAVLRTAFDKLPPHAQANWIWWRLPMPPFGTARFADMIEDAPSDVAWHSQEETARLLDMMSDIHRAKLEWVKRNKRRTVATIYKRTRHDAGGNKVQRAEIRFDDIAGCLRTPAGGSSRQLIMVVDGDNIRSRLISGRETARLMGLPDDYILPDKYNETYHLTGDGVVVPVVRHIAEHLFEPLLAANRRENLDLRKAA